MIDPGLLCHGGGMGHARYYSRFIALQIKAAHEGKALKQYLDTPVPPKLMAADGRK
jgi:hypothetical protein